MAFASKNSTIVKLSQQLSRPEHEIIAFRNKQPLSIRDLKKQVLLLSNALHHNPNKHWALYMQDSFNFVAGLLALFYVGKHPYLLNPHYQELQHHFEGLLTDNVEINKKELLKKEIVTIDQINSNNLIEDSQLINNDFKQQTLTLFTSGSTGLPKSIDKSILQLEYEIQELQNNWGEFNNDLFLSSVSHEHMYGLTFKIMLSLCSKIPFVCEAILYQEQLITYNNKKIIYITTPSIIKTLDSKLPKIDCDKVISSGGKLTYEEAQFCKQNFNVLPNEIYGSSETGIIATRQQEHINTAWQLFSSMKIEYISERPQLISPLLAQPEPLNDKLKKVDDNHFHLIGRIDKIIKISENRVSLTYIENQINQLNEVQQAIIIPIEQNNRTVLGAIIELSPKYKQQLKHKDHFKLTQYFRHLLIDTLSLNEMPKKWRFIDYLPKNSQGKCTYIELKKLFETSEKRMKKEFSKEISINFSDTQADIELHISPDLFWFKGHFPSQPLLPGVTQLNWVVHYAKKCFDSALYLSSVDVIKFQCPVLPEDHLMLHLKWDKDTNKLEFTYTFITPNDNAKIASLGKLTLCR
ncbi:hypothetical protein A9G34_04290 [Gilliamella sp. Choc4-2]|uniref:ApeI family dehydratase n=1 Tax=unclassified Gilliamella TaxID=2685620 RepID=UPI00080E44A5|nr:AMP-binding protein [Gilliamella apicola]OCG32728.1 hypothetical protein A9G33_02820 [Gilliamella apicola]OCG46742.1 hypothetical protein A9G34_04290 [Gilliamella apicola]